MSKEEEEPNASVALALQDLGSQVTVQDLLDGGAIPSNLDSKEKIVTVIQHGRELGLDPVTSLGGIHVIKGRTVISSAILGALLKRNGYEFIFTKDFDKEEAADNPKTEVTLYWVSKTLNREMCATFSVTWKEMSLAGYTTKDNWAKYPKNMMRARCLAYAVRAIAPEVLLGVYSDTELVDAMPNTGKRVTIDEEGETVVIDTDFEEVDG
jgi:hypothetical protein